MDFSTAPTPAHPPVPDPRPTTGTWGWIAFAVLTVVLSVPADLFISLVFTTSCSQSPDLESVQQGRIAMLVVLVVAALPWLVAVPLSRSGGLGLLIGLVALFPAVVFTLHGFSDGAWSTSLCLGG